jgi:hypothetical protein
MTVNNHDIIIGDEHMLIAHHNLKTEFVMEDTY